MSAVAALFLVAALSAALFAAAGAPSLVVAHGFFALGVLPLMLAAITHFVPVLTRSGAPAKAMHALPAVAALAGALVVAAFAAVVPRHLLLLAALVVGATALSMIAWIVARARRALGTPHPGVRWYVVALGFLCLAMIAAFGVVLDPSRHGVWRALHVHLNLFGWIGLTALGTLPVLLPTALGRPDPDAARRLRTGLGPAAGAVLLISSGASAGWPLIGAAGGLLLGGVGLRLVLAWYRLYGVAAVLPRRWCWPPWHWRHFSRPASPMAMVRFPR